MIAVLLAALPVYFLPTIIAIVRLRPLSLIFLWNGYLGWTVVGWFAALAWVFSSTTARWEYQWECQSYDLRSRPVLHKTLMVLYFMLICWLILSKLTG